ECVLRQKSRPLTGLSAGISSDAGGLNERFNHVAVLGNSLQSLSQLPRTELSEIYESNQVCFAAGGADSFPRKEKPMPLKEHEKKAHEQLAECYSSIAAGMKSFAAGEPDGENKLTEARKRLKACYDSNTEMFDSMPDEPLMKQSHALEKQPAKGTEIITEEGPSTLGDESGVHSFSAEGDDPRIAKLLKELQETKNQFAGAVGKLARKDFDSEIAELRRAGHELPPDDAIAAQFQVCFSSAKPKDALSSLLGMFKSMPKRASAASYGTVLGAAGISPAGGASATPAAAKRSERTKAHEDLGVMFSSDDIAFGLAIGDVLDTAAKAN